MASHSIVLLVDLAEQAPAYQRALSQLGIASQAVTANQLKEAFAESPPRGMVTSVSSVEPVLGLLRNAAVAGPVPWFVLAPDEKVAKRQHASVREISTIVAQDIDPGVLCLRFKTALQRARSAHKSRHPTLLGFGTERTSDEKQAANEAREAAREAMASVISLSQPPPEQSSRRPPAPPGSRTRSSRPPAEDSTRPPVASTPNPFEVAAAAGPAATSRPKPIETPAPANVHTSAPPMSTAPPSSGSSKLSGQEMFSVPDNPVPSDLSALESTPGVAPQSHFSASPDTSSGQPVTTSISSTNPVLDDETVAFAGGGSSFKHQALRYGIPGLAGVLLLGFGLSFLADSDEDQPAQLVQAAEPGDAAAAPTPATEKQERPSEPARNEPEAVEEPEGSETPDADSTADADSTPDAESGRFRIENAASLDDCEALLQGKADDLASKPKWHATMAWKQARKNLMAGKQSSANELMCKASFIDPAGPATAGLVKFYLGARALPQAEALAERGIEKSAGDSRELKELLGDVLSQRGEVERARALWLETMKLSVDDTKRLESVVRNFLRLAIKSRRGGDTALAERLLRRAAAFEPDNPAVAAELSYVLQKNDQPKLAKTWAEHALSLEPDSAMAKGVLSSL